MRAGIGGGTFVIEERVIERRFADGVLLSGPVAQVVQLAALTAEGEFGVSRGIRGLFANGAAVFHGIG
jgi:hypothetical protein